jgi:hypothetical protein
MKTYDPIFFSLFCITIGANETTQAEEQLTEAWRLCHRKAIRNQECAPLSRHASLQLINE